MTEKKKTSIPNAKRQYIITLESTLLAIWVIVNFTFLWFYFLARRDAISLGERSVSEQSEEIRK